LLSYLTQTKLTHPFPSTNHYDDANPAPFTSAHTPTLLSRHEFDTSALACSCRPPESKCPPYSARQVMRTQVTAIAIECAFQSTCLRSPPQSSTCSSLVDSRIVLVSSPNVVRPCTGRHDNRPLIFALIIRVRLVRSTFDRQISFFLCFLMSSDSLTTC
jgi:hypothetical protein